MKTLNGELIRVIGLADGQGETINIISKDQKFDSCCKPNKIITFHLGEIEYSIGIKYGEETVKSRIFAKNMYEAEEKAKKIASKNGGRFSFVSIIYRN